MYAFGGSTRASLGRSNLPSPASATIGRRQLRDQSRSRLTAVSFASMTLGKDPQHWHDRAAQMRVLADSIKDAEARTIMLKLADDYDKLAERADAPSQIGSAG